MTAGNSRGRPLWLPALLSVFASGTAFAGSAFLPYASEQYEHNNNVFALENSSQAVAASGDPTLGDSDLRTVGGFEEDYLWDRQRLFGIVEGRYIKYDHFGYLSHSEYLAKLDLDWKLFSFLDGTLLGSQERVMAPFANRDTQTALAIDTDRHAIGKFNVRIAPEWRLETSVDYHDLDSPIQGFPNYGLTETTEHAAVKYLGFSSFTYGFSADYVDGRYRNSPVVGTYTQTNLNLTMTYAATGLSSFNGAVGHTQRDQGQNQGNLSEVTGELGYMRQLSGKTSIHLDCTRAVNNYIGAGGSELDSAVNLTINYQPTFKTGMSIGVQRMWSNFLAQTVPGTDVLGRKDNTVAASFKMNYQALRWLLIQPYANYQRRNSNDDIFSYSGTIVGIQILAKKPAPPAR
ncbi:MAG TPA: hypothetical protein VKG63_19490 [Steroidobacteraceae bacterium]|nr:hypothetical protein [Steroidobacteraceae bacterium]